MARIGLADVRLTLGHCALDAQLGPYYQDIRQAISLVEGGYHGILDEKGVPKSWLDGAWRENPTHIAQYALALHDSIVLSATHETRSGLAPRMRAQLEALEQALERTGPRRGFAVMTWDDPKYRLRRGWVSGMYQGNIVSALLRGWQLFGEDRWRDLAHIAFLAMGTPLSEGGVAVRQPHLGHDELWFEEYPMTPPSHVLNGSIYALWGVLDWARATGDAQAWEWWRSGAETLRRRLPEFDSGYWSLYDLRFKELASLYYQQNIHVPQMQAMYLLTGEPIFEQYGKRWDGQSRSLLCRARWAVMLRVHARLGRRRFGLRHDQPPSSQA